ncbi:MAG TPA: DinB family protein [Bryobacteraceae bacterium]|nr:DinB family protein [Bryobacteraceae bacterium]
MNRLLLLSLLALVPAFAADPRMNPQERANALKWLEESRKEFLAAIDGVSDAQWKWRPAPGRWSVGEVAEHIVLGEASQFANVKKAIASPPDPDWETRTKGKTERLVQVLAPRLGKAQAPEAIVPKGGMTQAQVKERFERQRAEIVKFTTETDAPLKQGVVVNPFFGPLNGYNWLIYAPLHTMRHDKQIAEVKATPGYPK